MATTITKKKGLPIDADSRYDIINVLKKSHEIPYHSRPFMWTREKYAELVVKEIINAWKNNEEYWLGVLIVYTGGKIPAISDG